VTRSLTPGLQPNGSAENASRDRPLPRERADQLDSDREVTLGLGGAAILVNPTNPVPFTLEGESDWSEGTTETKQSTEFELVW
jgi:hypothetical protein